MKKLIMSLTVLSILFVSCSKDEVPVIAEVLGTMSYKVNGTLVDVKAPNGAATATASATGATIISSIQGGNSLFLALNNNKVGKYILDDASNNTNNGTYVTSNNGYTTENLNDGTVEIKTSTSTKITGTFKFTGYDSNSKKVEITEGVFDAPVIK
jgi:hypothetical protein